ncbi:A24 family peptidase [Spirillospora sp. NPDC047279]|uniref:prepilin peptidase n=1 Tax=Spirillospora sp. NPDC047279 TaxID=3155478 RepID=UPI0033EE89F1
MTVDDARPETGAPGPGPGEAPEAAAERVIWSWRADWTEPLRRRVPLVACSAVAVALLIGWRVGPGADLPAFVWLAGAGVMLAFVDVALHRLPDPLTLTSYPVGLLLLGAAAPFTADGGERYVEALIGLGVMLAVFAAQWAVVPRAMGLGDVKLSGVLGLYLGWLGMDAWLLGLVGMFMVGGSYALGVLILRRAAGGTEFPFGPFMLIGTLIAVLVHA